jgi:hypothetical protein
MNVYLFVTFGFWTRVVQKVRQQFHFPYTDRLERRSQLLVTDIYKIRQVDEFQTLLSSFTQKRVW